jgi:hypothetical protein
MARNYRMTFSDEIWKSIEQVSKEADITIAALVKMGVNEQIAAHNRRLAAARRAAQPTLICWYCDGGLNHPNGECTNESCKYAVHQREERAAIDRAEFAAASGL